MQPNTPSTQTAQEIETLKTAFDDFSYAVSHDLRSPIRHIKQFTKLLTDTLPADALSAEQQEFVDFIQLGVTNAEDMLAALLQYSRLNTTDLDITEVDLNQVVAKAQADLQPSIDATQAKIEVQPLPTIRGDQTRLKTLFKHLLDNAIKFQPEGQTPHIQINCDQVDEGYRLTITDNGLGIPADQFTEVFIMFKQLHPAHLYAGTGSGLTICQRIMQQHVGDIKFVNITKGSQIELSFPAS